MDLFQQTPRGVDPDSVMGLFQQTPRGVDSDSVMNQFQQAPSITSRGMHPDPQWWAWVSVWILGARL